LKKQTLDPENEEHTTNMV